MVHCPIAAVMIHVGSIGAGLDWYQRAFPDAARSTLKVSGFEVLTISGVQIEIVLSDEKVASGPGGAVVYWHVPKLSEALAHMEKIGATLYRGPLEIEDGFSICQVQDPWGNCIGLRGQTMPTNG